MQVSEALFDKCVGVVSTEINFFLAHADNYSAKSIIPAGICLHVMGGSYGSARNEFGSGQADRLKWAVGQWEKKKNGPRPTKSPTGPSSAHLGVSQLGDACCYVPHYYRAFHAGITTESAHRWTGLQRSPDGKPLDPNRYLIGIEHEGGPAETWEKHPNMLETSATLGAILAVRWGFLLTPSTVCGHRQLYDRKACPGTLDVRTWILRAEAIRSTLNPQQMLAIHTKVK